VVIPRWVSPRLKPRAECTKPLFRGWGDGRTGELSFDGFKIEGSGWLCSGNDNGRTALRPSNEIELFLTASGPESVLRDVWALLWHSVSKSREVTWDHRSCHRRFSRRVTTAELIVRCPDMPSTQRCRLGGIIDQMFAFRQVVVRLVKATTYPLRISLAGRAQPLHSERKSAAW
jgi:hypothetical protein